jgi:hypothetical protein
MRCATCAALVLGLALAVGWAGSVRPDPAVPAPSDSMRATSGDSTRATLWDSIRATPMRGGLAIFWDVLGDNAYNRPQAVRHGFRIVDLLNTFADYPGNQREAITDIVSTNPWRKSPFFERTIRRNIAATGGHDLFVHDIEFDLEKDADKAWMDGEARRASGVQTQKAFRDAYWREWASWYVLPVRWAKRAHPGEPIGIYGPQPFERDYWGIAGKDARQIEAAHAWEGKLWKYIDPYVDVCLVSAYCFYDEPGSLYYMAANIEENYRRTRRYGRKPVYAYLCLRRMEKDWNGPELPPYLIEASALLPFFSGARGLVLWGYERGQGQPFRSLPLFMNSLARISELSPRISKARLILDEPAHVLWNEKRPLQRKLKISASEWLVLAVNPWQDDDAHSEIRVTCGKRTFRLDLEGRHTDLFHIRGSRVERLRCKPPLISP